MLTARREEIERVPSEVVNETVPLHDCKVAGKKLLEVIWVDSAHKKNRPRLCAREYKTKKEGKIQRASIASQLFSAMPPLEVVKALVSIMMLVSWSSKAKPLKLRHYDIRRAHFQMTAQRLTYIRLPAQNRQTFGEDKVGRLINSMYGPQDASHIWHVDYANLICGELDSEEANTLQHCSTTQTRM